VAGATPLLISADNPGPLTGDGNNTWLIDGAEPTLVDAGIGAASHVDAVARALGGRPLARVLVTHGHPDHASGAPALRARWPSLECWKWKIDGDDASWRGLSEGQIVRAGERALAVLHTPGHAIDHVCFWDAASRALYAGDMIRHPGTVVIPAGRGGNLRDYLRSLDRLAALDPGQLFPGHGAIVDRPREVIAEYIAHRHAREEQVIACLRDGVTDIEGIVDRIYAGLASDLRDAARSTVRAHLDKLRDEQRLP
jgi:glyoxylase-like metal-dependent hydrolase (beta-lactamase superfamily II)